MGFRHMQHYAAWVEKKGAHMQGDWLYALCMGAVIVGAYRAYKWWQQAGKQWWDDFTRKLLK